jgi:gluconolactonase
MKSGRVFGTIVFGLALGFAPVSATGQQLAGEREATVTAIPGVIAAGAKWVLAWDGYDNADGILGAPDGSLLFAQEQPGRVRKLAPDDSTSVYMEGTDGAGSLSMDAAGRLFAAERTCTDPGLRLAAPCEVRTKISILAPNPRVLTDRLPNGEPLGRVNDLVADSKGGAYFTSGGAWYVNREGDVITVSSPDEIRSNGIMLSPDEQTLYVTNRDVVVAFDVGPDGSVSDRRDLGSLGTAGGGDGMAIDGAGRLYVTANDGVHVFSPEGAHLGVIPTPRRPITVAFAGPEKRTLYIVGSGAVDVFRRGEYETPEGVRNNAKTIYRIPMLAAGFSGRPK